MPEADALSPERLLARTGSRRRRRGRASSPAVPSDDACSRARSPRPTPCSSSPGATERDGHAAACAAVHRARQRRGAIAASVPDRASARRVSGRADEHRHACDRAAVGRGLISVDPEGGVIRRVPLAASVSGTLVPALAIEMLRVAIGAPSVRLLTFPAREWKRCRPAISSCPTEDRRRRPHLLFAAQRRPLHLGDRRPRRQGRPGAASREARADRRHRRRHASNTQNTPVGERMPGSEIHAQLLENLYDGTLLRRPDWAPWLETLLFLHARRTGSSYAHSALEAAQCRTADGRRRRAACGDRLRRLSRAAARSSTAATPAVGSHAAVRACCSCLYARRGDAARKGARARRAASSASRTARIAGELDAAQRIQTATLPRADLLREAMPRIDLAATMIPAREVGGDLYDFFRLDERRLFFLVGDVAGKGSRRASSWRSARRCTRARSCDAGAPTSATLDGGGECRGFARQPGDAVRHRVRRRPRSRVRRARLLQRGSRESASSLDPADANRRVASKMAADRRFARSTISLYRGAERRIRARRAALRSSPTA